eukprot:gene6544-biopygen3232
MEEAQLGAERRAPRRGGRAAGEQRLRGGAPYPYCVSVRVRACPWASWCGGVDGDHAADDAADADADGDCDGDGAGDADGYCNCDGDGDGEGHCDCYYHHDDDDDDDDDGDNDDNDAYANANDGGGGCAVPPRQQPQSAAGRGAAPSFLGWGVGPVPAVSRRVGAGQRLPTKSEAPSNGHSQKIKELTGALESANAGAERGAGCGGGEADRKDGEAGGGASVQSSEQVGAHKPESKPLQDKSESDERLGLSETINLTGLVLTQDLRRSSGVTAMTHTYMRIHECTPAMSANRWQPRVPTVQLVTQETPPVNLHVAGADPSGENRTICRIRCSRGRFTPRLPAWPSRIHQCRHVDRFPAARAHRTELVCIGACRQAYTRVDGTSHPRATEYSTPCTKSSAAAGSAQLDGQPSARCMRAMRAVRGWARVPPFGRGAGRAAAVHDDDDGRHDAGGGEGVVEREGEDPDGGDECAERGENRDGGKLRELLPMGAPHRRRRCCSTPAIGLTALGWMELHQEGPTRPLRISRLAKSDMKAGGQRRMGTDEAAGS